MCPLEYRFRPAGAFVDDIFAVLIANQAAGMGEAQETLAKYPELPRRPLVKEGSLNHIGALVFI